MPANNTCNDNLVGEVVDGYLLVDLLGAGSTSSVYLGAHLETGHKAAVKILAADLVGDNDRVRRLLMEAQILERIRHPNIVEVRSFTHACGPSGVAMVMELVAGPTLDEIEPGSLSFGQAIGVAVQVVGALEAAHAVGVVHRDVKPSNVLLGRDPRGRPDMIPPVKIVDFGVAKMAGSALGRQPATAVMIGTPAYMAPEQIAGSPPPSDRTDVYAVGELLYEMLSGRRAYAARSVDSVVHAKLCGIPPDLTLPPDHPGQVLLPLIRSCLAPAATERPSMDDVYQELLDVSPAATLSALGLDADSGLSTETVRNDAVAAAVTHVDMPGEGPTLAGLLSPSGAYEPLTLFETREFTVRHEAEDSASTRPSVRAILD